MVSPKFFNGFCWKWLNKFKRKVKVNWHKLKYIIERKCIGLICSKWWDKPWDFNQKRFQSNKYRPVCPGHACSSYPLRSCCTGFDQLQGSERQTFWHLKRIYTQSCLTFFDGFHVWVQIHGFKDTSPKLEIPWFDDVAVS